MRRQASILASILAAAAALAPGAHAAGASLTASGVPTFPERSWILTLPRGVTVAPSDVRVREDGVPVRDLDVTPADGGASQGLGVVLVIDASQSMTGAPIEAAMASARVFARQRSAGQRIGIVTFNSTTKVLLAPTTDAARIDAALAQTPALLGGTHLFDAASAGVRLLRRSGGQAGAVIVLSDGADRGSAASAKSVAAAAGRAHVRVFTVGVRSAKFEDGTLKDLAGAASGDYLGAATGSSLVRLYRDLGGQLANAYLVRYRSTNPVGSRIRVAAVAHGRRAVAVYRAPSLEAVAEARATKRAAAQTPFLRSAGGIAVVTAVTLLASFLVLWTLLAARRRGRGVRDRVADYGTDALHATAVESEKPAAPRSSRPGAARLARLAEQLDIARLEMTAAQFLILTALAGVAGAWLATAVAGSAIVVPLVFILTGLGARAFLQSRVERQRAKFADQLADSLQGVASAMRTGHSFAGALAVQLEEAGEPTASEFGRVIADERLGIPLEQALQETVRRMGNRDLEQVALVAILQRESGGNGSEALDRVVENLRGRDEVRRLVKSLTSQGQLTRWILTAIPVALMLLLTAVSAEYMDPLLHGGTGHALLILAALLVTAGSLSIKRIVDIKV